MGGGHKTKKQQRKYKKIQTGFRVARVRSDRCGVGEWVTVAVITNPRDVRGLTVEYKAP